MGRQSTVLLTVLPLSIHARAALAEGVLATFAGTTWKDVFSRAVVEDPMLFSGPDSATVTSVDQIFLTIHGHQYAAAEIICCR